MIDESSVLEFPVISPADFGDPLQKKAALFLDGEACQNRLWVSLKNISGASLSLEHGAQIKLSFNGLQLESSEKVMLDACKTSLDASAEANPDLSQRNGYWFVQTEETALVLHHSGNGFEWVNEAVLEFMLSYLFVDPPQARAATLTIDVVANPTPQAIPAPDLPLPVEICLENKVVYTKLDGSKNNLRFSLVNKGSDINGKWIEISLLYGDGPGDLISCDNLPILAAEATGGASLGNIETPDECDGQLTWFIDRQPILLPENGRVDFTLSDIVTHHTGVSNMTVALKGLNDYKDQTYTLEIWKEEGLLEITSFEGRIEHVNGKPELVLSWKTNFAYHCTIEPLVGRCNPCSDLNSCRFPLQDLSPVTYTLTAYAEPEVLNVSQTLTPVVLPPEILYLKISDADHVKGIVNVEWSTANATFVHLRLEESVFHLWGNGINRYFDADVGFSGGRWLSIDHAWLLPRTLTAILTTHGPFQKTETKSFSWTG